MKKKYIKPELTCIKIECEGIIAGSGRPNVKIHWTLQPNQEKGKMIFGIIRIRPIIV